MKTRLQLIQGWIDGTLTKEEMEIAKEFPLVVNAVTAHYVAPKVMEPRRRVLRNG